MDWTTCERALHALRDLSRARTSSDSDAPSDSDKVSESDLRAFLEHVESVLRPQVIRNDLRAKAAALALAATSQPCDKRAMALDVAVQKARADESQKSQLRSTIAKQENMISALRQEIKQSESETYWLRRKREKDEKEIARLRKKSVADEDAISRRAKEAEKIARELEQLRHTEMLKARKIADMLATDTEHVHVIARLRLQVKDLSQAMSAVRQEMATVQQQSEANLRMLEQNAVHTRRADKKQRKKNRRKERKKHMEQQQQAEECALQQAVEDARSASKEHQITELVACSFHAAMKLALTCARMDSNANARVLISTAEKRLDKCAQDGGKHVLGIVAEVLFQDAAERRLSGDAALELTAPSMSPATLLRDMSQDVLHAMLQRVHVLLARPILYTPLNNMCHQLDRLNRRVSFNADRIDQLKHAVYQWRFHCGQLARRERIEATVRACLKKRHAAAQRQEIDDSSRSDGRAAAVRDAPTRVARERDCTRTRKSAKKRRAQDRMAERRCREFLQDASLIDMNDLD